MGTDNLSLQQIGALLTRHQQLEDEMKRVKQQLSQIPFHMLLSDFLRSSGKTRKQFVIHLQLAGISCERTSADKWFNGTRLPKDPQVVTAFTQFVGMDDVSANILIQLWESQSGKRCSRKASMSQQSKHIQHHRGVG